MKKILFSLLPFIYLFVLLFQIDQSLLEDLGRHLKMGEAIMHCICVPETNLFSYTNPDFPVINHEWLTQVILFFFYKNFGLQSLLFLKMIIITISFGIVYYLAKHKSSSFWLTIVSILCVLIFSSRFRVRPEMFSYLFISLFLLILYLYEKTKKNFMLLFLPLIEIFWVNMHIYFILGIMTYVTFLLQEFIQKKKPDIHLFFIGGLILLATLLNPQFIKGALLPLTFSSNYALSVEENMSVFDFGKFAPSFIFTLSLQIVLFEVLVSIFLLTLPILFRKNAIATNCNAVLTGFLGLRFVRSLSLFGLFTLSPLSEKLTTIEKVLLAKTDKYFLNTIKTIVFLMTIFIAYTYANGLYQNNVLQFKFQPYAEDATNFINNNHLRGPIFNNYHIGNYLIYGLYPHEKVFIDARPEMYPAAFLTDYKRMYVDQAFFDKEIKRYKINLIVMGVQLEDPLTIRPFMLRQMQSKEWIPIYADGNVTILIKNTVENIEIIKKFGIKM